MENNNLEDRHFMDFMRNSPERIEVEETEQIDVVENGTIEKIKLVDNGSLEEMNQQVIGTATGVALSKDHITEAHAGIFRNMNNCMETKMEQNLKTPYPYEFRSPSCSNNMETQVEQIKMTSDPYEFRSTPGSEKELSGYSSYNAFKSPQATGMEVNESGSQNAFLNNNLSHCQSQSFHPQLMNDPLNAAAEFSQKQSAYGRSSTPAYNACNIQPFADITGIESSFPSTVHHYQSSIQDNRTDSSQELRAKVVASSVAPKMNYTPEQRQLLGEEFVNSPLCPRDRKSKLAKRLNLVPEAVTKYFQTARTKLKRQIRKKSYSMAPHTPTTSVVLQHFNRVESRRTVRPNATSSPVPSFSSGLRAIHPELAAHLERVISPLHRRLPEVPSVGMASDSPQPCSDSTSATSQAGSVLMAGSSAVSSKECKDPPYTGLKENSESMFTKDRAVPSQRFIPSSSYLWQPFTNSENKRNRRKPTHPKRHETEAKSLPAELGYCEAKNTPTLVIEPDAYRRPQSTFSIYRNESPMDLTGASATSVMNPGMQSLAQSAVPYPQSYYMAGTTFAIQGASSGKQWSTFASAPLPSSTNPLPSGSTGGKQGAFPQVLDPSIYQQMVYPHAPLVDINSNYTSSVLGQHYAGLGWPVQSLGHAHSYWLPTWRPSQQQASSSLANNICDASKDQWSETGL